MGNKKVVAQIAKLRKIQAYKRTKTTHAYALGAQQALEWSLGKTGGIEPAALVKFLEMCATGKKYGC